MNRHENSMHQQIRSDSLTKIYKMNVFPIHTQKKKVKISGFTVQSVVVVLRLNVPVNNFSVMSGRSHRFLGN